MDGVTGIGGQLTLPFPVLCVYVLLHGCLVVACNRVFLEELIEGWWETAERVTGPGVRRVLHYCRQYVPPPCGGLGPCKHTTNVYRMLSLGVHPLVRGRSAEGEAGGRGGNKQEPET